VRKLNKETLGKGTVKNVAAVINERRINVRSTANGQQQTVNSKRSTANGQQQTVNK
jgi:hypothetical protein